MLNIIGILLLLSFAKFKVIALNSKLPKDLETVWLKSQVMIYHNSKPSQDFSLQEPDCFGNVLTKYHVLTTASCFIELIYMLKCAHVGLKPKYQQQNEMNLESIKTGINIKDTLITKVIHVKYILSVKWVIQLYIFYFIIGYTRHRGVK